MKTVLTAFLKKWEIKGELILNCNCTVFCPCVVSLGKHPPTETFCQAWAGIRIDEGYYAEYDLSGINVAMMLEIPGRMARGNWKAAVFIDENASTEAYDGLLKILSGQARGTTGLFTKLVSEIIGTERAQISYQTDGKTRHLTVGNKIQGSVTPIVGNDPNREVTVNNTRYWMGSDITVAQADKGRVRAFARIWDFKGLSAEICQIHWHGPN